MQIKIIDLVKGFHSSNNFGDTDGDRWRLSYGDIKGGGNAVIIVSAEMVYIQFHHIALEITAFNHH